MFTASEKECPIFRLVLRIFSLRAYSSVLSPDYPKEIQREHYLLEKVHRLARRDGRSTRLRGNKLHYNGKVYSVKDVHTAGLDIGRIAERRDDLKVKFYGRFSMLSNFFPIELTYKGSKFSCAEQLYHYKRAEKANDPSLALEIMLAHDPIDCKALSKRIPANQTSDIQLMREVIQMKFENETFKNELRKTGKATILECNPHDQFWSVGCHIDDKDPDHMKGKNHLGVILEGQRERIFSNETG